MSNMYKDLSEEEIVNQISDGNLSLIEEAAKASLEPIVVNNISGSDKSLHECKDLAGEAKIYETMDKLVEFAGNVNSLGSRVDDMFDKNHIEKETWIAFKKGLINHLEVSVEEVSDILEKNIKQ